MARYTGPVCRSRRRDGTKLFLKGASFSEKWPVEKRNFPPARHGQSKKVGLSATVLQLREKQKAKRIYLHLETQLRAYYQKAANKTGVTGELLLQQLETRLDNVAYRLGFALQPPPVSAPGRPSRSHHRQRPQGQHPVLPGQGGRRDRDQGKIQSPGHARRVEELRRRSKLSPMARHQSRRGSPARSSPCPSAKTSTCLSTEQLIVELYSK